MHRSFALNLPTIRENPRSRSASCNTLPHLTTSPIEFAFDDRPVGDPVYSASHTPIHCDPAFRIAAATAPDDVVPSDIRTSSSPTFPSAAIIAPTIGELVVSTAAPLLPRLGFLTCPSPAYYTRSPSTSSSPTEAFPAYEDIPFDGSEDSHNSSRRSSSGSVVVNSPPIDSLPFPFPSLFPFPASPSPSSPSLTPSPLSPHCAGATDHHRAAELRDAAHDAYRAPQDEGLAMMYLELAEEVERRCEGRTKRGTSAKLGRGDRKKGTGRGKWRVGSKVGRARMRNSRAKKKGEKKRGAERRKAGKTRMVEGAKREGDKGGKRLGMVVDAALGRW